MRFICLWFMFVNTLSPIIFSIGPLDIRYYGLAYLLGFLFGYVYLRYSINKKRLNLTFEQLDNFFLYLMLGGILGGRLGEFLFYSPLTFFTDPLQIIYIWQGGMSIHGGLLGGALAIWLFVRKQGKVSFLELADFLVVPLAFALFLGRIANF